MVERKLLDELQKIDTEECLKMSLSSFCKYMIEQRKLFHDEDSFKLFVLDNVQRAYIKEDADWPIRYYAEDEEISEEDKFVDTTGVEFLTDESIEQLKLDTKPDLGKN